jgi:formylglycine-generating enzyme required for sulfatase activity
MNPVGPGTGGSRVLRGGHWGDYAPNCRSALRNYINPDYAFDDVGFRPVRSAN